MFKPEEIVTGQDATIHVLHEGMEPASLLRRLQARDVEAAAAFYDRYGPLVDRLVWSLLGADAEHQDIVHDVLCKLLENTHQVRDPNKLDAWVRSVTTFTVRSVLRKRKVRRRFAGEVSDLENHQRHIDDAAARETLQAFYRVLAELSPDLRIAFAYKYVDQMTLEEIAQCCESSRSTIKRRLNKAKARFIKLARREPALYERLARSLRFEETP